MVVDVHDSSLVVRWPIRRMEDLMRSLGRLVPVVVGLVLSLTTAPTWGASPVCVAPGCNPTVTDVNGNTAGGTDALTGGTNSARCRCGEPLVMSG